MREVEWLCTKGYPENKKTEKVSDENLELRKKILKILQDQGFKVNKQQVDMIITAGLFDHIGNRMGNKAAREMKLPNTFNQVVWDQAYYTDAIEGYGLIGGHSNKLTVLILVVLILFVYYRYT